MPNLCEFTDPHTRQKVWINPLNITRVESISPGIGAVIYFDPAYAVSVAEAIADVIKELNDALGP